MNLINIPCTDRPLRDHLALHQLRRDSACWLSSQWGTGENDSHRRRPWPTERARGSQRRTQGASPKGADCYAGSASLVWAPDSQSLGSQWEEKRRNKVGAQKIRRHQNAPNGTAPRSSPAVPKSAVRCRKVPFSANQTV